MATLRRLLPMVVAAAPLLGCSASLRHGVRATDAAAQIEQVTHSSSNEMDPAVSPDARWLAFDQADSLGSRPRIEVLATADLKSSSPVPAFSSNDKMGLEPAWMPTGSIVFESDAGLAQTLGGSVVPARFRGPVGASDFRGSWPAMSLDGRLALSIGATTQYRTGWLTSRSLDDSIGVTDLSGPGLNVIPGTDPAWSPDGKKLAFARLTDGHMHLFVAAPDGSGAVQITDGSEDDRQPAWSPDGQNIAFCSVRLNEEGWEQGNLFVVRPDGSGLVQLTEGDALACRPDWASDGYIYFHANARDNFHIWRLRRV